MRYERYTNRSIRNILAVLFCLLLLLSTAVPSMPVRAAATLGTVDHIADADTRNTYEQALDLFHTSRYAGRVWSDKSVFTGDVALDYAHDGIEGYTVSCDSDFLHVFSALGSSQQPSELTPIPLDVVFILDVSGSMTFTVDGEYRIDRATKALNNIFDFLMKDNSLNRVALVAYSGKGTAVNTNYEARNGEVMLELGRYESQRVTVPAHTFRRQQIPAKTYDGFFASYDIYMSQSAAEGTFRAIAKSEAGQYQGKVAKETIAVQGATNTQMGLFKGMSILADPEVDTHVMIDGMRVQRRPVVILITDGQPTCSASSAEWWNPQNDQFKGPGNNVHYGNGVLAMMTAAYMKREINLNYCSDRDAVGDDAARVYTIGVDIDELLDGDAAKEFARAVLDPKDHLNDTTANATAIREAWNAYLNGGFPDVEVDTPSQTSRWRYNDDVLPRPAEPKVETGIWWWTEWGEYGYDANGSYGFISEGQDLWEEAPREGVNGNYYPTNRANAFYTFTQRPDPDIPSLIYNDAFYDVSSADLSDQLQTILRGERLKAFIPIEGVNDLQGENMLTYVDPIGKYMEVKDVKSMLLFGKMYALKKKTEEPETGAYVDGSWTPGEGPVTRQYYTFENANLTQNQWNPAYDVDGKFPDDLSELPPDTLGVFRFSQFEIYVETTGDVEDPDVADSPIESDAGYDQALYFSIPADALPIWVAKLNIEPENREQSVSYTTSRDAGKPLEYASPIRLFYTVGVADSILSGEKDAQRIDLTKVDAEYLKAYKDPDQSQVYFYSNWYAKEKSDYPYLVGVGHSYGDPVLSFSPSEGNRYYIFRKHLRIYKAPEEFNENDYIEDPTRYEYVVQQEGADSVTVRKGETSLTLEPATKIESGNWYYIVIDYYDHDKKFDDALTQLAVPRKGSMFGSGIGENEFGAYLSWLCPVCGGTMDVTEAQMGSGTAPSGAESHKDWCSHKGSGGGWILATKQGGVRAGNMSRNVQSKESRFTYSDHSIDPNTAGTYYVPTISRGSGFGAEGTVINNYMGNNGRLTVTDTQVLVTKTVEGDDPLVDGKATEFTFTIQLEKAGAPVYQNETISAIRVVQDNDEPDSWRALVDTIELFTNGDGLLLDANGAPAVYSKDGAAYYLHAVGAAQGSGTVTVFDSNNGKLGETVTADVHLVPKEAYDKGEPYESGEPIKVPVATVNWEAAIGHEVEFTEYRGKTTYLTEQVAFVNGVAIFDLHHGEGLLFNGLDPNVKYTIKEILSKEQLALHWKLAQVKKSNAEGKLTTRPAVASESVSLVGGAYQRDEDGEYLAYIVEDYTSAAPVTAEEHFYNGLEEDAGLEIEKKVFGPADKDATFRFEITLKAPVYEEDGTPGEGYEPIAEGSIFHAYIHAADHMIPIAADPGDTEEPLGRPCVPEDHPHPKAGAAAQGYRDLDLYIGANGAAQVITQWNADGTKPAEGDGLAPLMLKAGEIYVITGLPEGTQYTIAETFADEETDRHYTTTIEVEENDGDGEERWQTSEPRTVTGTLNSSNDTSRGIPTVRVIYNNMLLVDLPSAGGNGGMTCLLIGQALMLLSLCILGGEALQRRKNRL